MLQNRESVIVTSSDIQRIIGRAVIDDNQFEILVGLPQHGVDCLAEVFAAVVARNNDADLAGNILCPEVMVGPQLDITQIEKILPHRYPFLLVDRVLELTETRAVGLKCVTINDYFFRGHFPGHPVMPGVLIVEAMAQVGGIIMLNRPEHHGKMAYFMSVDKVKFRKPVVPGDNLVLEVELGKLRSRTGQLTGRALVDGKVVCQGEFMFALAE